MKPIVNGIEAEFAGQISVMRLDANITENADLLASYGLRGHPSFVLVDKNGQVIATFTGPQTADTLRTAVLDTINTP